MSGMRFEKPCQSDNSLDPSELRYELHLPLIEALKEVGSEHGMTILINGPQGVGKSYLINQLIEYANEKSFSVRKGASLKEDPTPFLPFLSMGVTFGSALIRNRNDGMATNTIAPEVVKEQLLVDLTRASMRFPILLVLEDLQWADSGTINLFHYIARKISGKRILMVASVRTGDHEVIRTENWAALGDSFRTLKKEGKLLEISVDPLDRGGVIQLVETELEGPIQEGLADLIVENCQGLPLYILEMTRYLIKNNYIKRKNRKWTCGDKQSIPIPYSIEGYIRNNLSHLEPGQQDLLCALSTFGCAFPAILALKLIENFDIMIPGEHCFKTLSDYLITDNGVCTFKHEMIQQVAYSSMPSSLRQKYHHGIAIIYQTLCEDDEYLDQISFHFFKANSWKESLPYSIEAARRSFQLDAYRESMEYYQRVIQSIGHVPKESHLDLMFETYERMGDINIFIGHYETSLVFFERALGMVKNNDDQARIFRKMANVWMQKDDYLHNETAKRYLDLALELTDLSPSELAEVMSYLSCLYYYLNDYPSAISFGTDACKRFEENDEKDKAIWQRMILAYCYKMNGEIALALEQTRIAGAMMNPNISRRVRKEYITVLSEFDFALGNYLDMLKKLDDLISLNDELGLYSEMSNNHWMKGLVYGQLMDHQRALDEAYISLDMAHIDDVKRAVARSNALIARECLVLGLIEEAEEALNEDYNLWEEQGLNLTLIGTSLYWIALGTLHIKKGSCELGLQEIEEGLKGLRVISHLPEYQAIGYSWASDALLWAGEIARAKALAGEAVDLLKIKRQV